jgi:hypothetical protein
MFGVSIVHAIHCHMYYASSTKESHLSFNGKITHTAIEKHNEKTMGSLIYVNIHINKGKDTASVTWNTYHSRAH